MQIKYFDKKLLVSANKEAIRSKRNRALKTKYLEKLPEDNLFPIVFSMVHNDVEMRLEVLLNETGDKGYIDVPFGTFDKLPSIDMPSDNQLEKGV